ncbi:MAG TPA: NAD(P)/FAD-dependent oxidoreductase, partial [Kofleriaceae bacterium]
MTRPNVLVIGAGLGGLCLAHGLRNLGIEVQIFERRPGPADQPASYGIHLDRDGLQALHACLPAKNWDALVAGARFAPDIVRFWTPELRTLAVHDREPAELDPITRRRAISRGVLRDALLLGLDVRWGTEFSRYEIEPDDTVTAHFTDGTTARGDLLVGADGSNSKVRRQRLPDVNRCELGILNLAGRAPLTPELANMLPPELIDGAVNNIVPATPGWMFVSTWRAGLQAETYIVWAWAAAIESYPEEIEQLSSAQLRDLVLGRIETWSPGLRQVVEASIPDSVARVPLRTMPILEAWDANQVTLLGDAIHNMTPMAGIGANTALRDAEHLTRALAGAGSVIERVARYEHHMRAYANDALGMSTRNARNAASPARLTRLTFR